MALLVSSRFVLASHAAAFACLLGATALMGIGFGLTIPVVNSLAASLFPRRVDVAVLALNALLGLGTALAPVFVAVFVGLGIWWGLPLTVGGLLAALIVWTLSLRSRLGVAERLPTSTRPRVAQRVAPVLAVRGVRALLRDRRDAQRQLGDPLHEGRARRAGRAGLPHAHAVLGGGHRGSRALRLDRPLALRAHARFACSPGSSRSPSSPRQWPRPRARVGGGSVRSGGPRLLGAAPPHHQPRSPGGVARSSHRLLSDRVRPGRVRDRSSARSRRSRFAAAVRGRGRDRVGPGRAVGGDRRLHPRARAGRTAGARSTGDPGDRGEECRQMQVPTVPPSASAQVFFLLQSALDAQLVLQAPAVASQA